MRYHYLDSGGRGRQAHGFRNTELEKQAPPMHTHDFFELYWVESGSLFEQRIEGRVELKAGDFRFAAPLTRHALWAAPGKAFRLANVIFPPALAQALAKRHGVAWRMGGALRAEALEALSRELDRLVQSKRSLLDAECFLLEAFRILRREETPLPSGPPWLQQALQTIEAPAAFSRGTSAFFEACGRSPEHVARECRKHTGKSPIQLVTGLRMGWAARQLEASTLEITAIALACGLENLGHFYAQFKRAYGVSPGGWRQRARRAAGMK